MAGDEAGAPGQRIAGGPVLRGPRRAAVAFLRRATASASGVYAAFITRRSASDFIELKTHTGAVRGQDAATTPRCSARELLLPGQTQQARRTGAIGYVLNPWTPPTAFLSDGAIPLNNNISERQTKRMVQSVGQSPVAQTIEACAAFLNSDASRMHVNQ